VNSTPYPQLPRNRIIEIAPGVPMEFVLVLPGTFVMGSKKGADYSGEKVEHLVKITRPFYLGRYAVTQAQWTAVTGQRPAHFVGDDRRPVEQVSWEEIMGRYEEEPTTQGFLDLLPALSGHTFQLPTEAEWEYAAKGGHLSSGGALNYEQNQVPAGSLYPSFAGGEDAKAVAWQKSNNDYSTLRGGYRQPNALGFYGMSGNVWDWCRDTFDRNVYTERSLKNQIVIDPLEEKPGRSRVVRGGGWSSFSDRCYPTFRNGRISGQKTQRFGFRLVLMPSSE
jgi:formylglycine-generating enzyme required for sulfatase activity